LGFGVSANAKARSREGVAGLFVWVGGWRFFGHYDVMLKGTNWLESSQHNLTGINPISRRLVWPIDSLINCF
jgi:hypothetical protein